MSGELKIEKQEVKQAIQTIIKFISNSTNTYIDQGDLIKNSDRIAQFYEDFFCKYSDFNLDTILEKSLIKTENIYKTNNNQLQEIALKNINFVSFCEHHLLKFEGIVDITYTPHNYLIGLDKLSLVVDYYASRLQLQERLNMQIIESIIRIIKPQKCTVSIKANHDCMKIRGQKKLNSELFTSQSWQSKQSF